MSRSSSALPASAKIELETVVNWPLLVSAAGAAVLLLAVPLMLACIAALKGRAVKDPVAALPAAPQPQPAKVKPPTTAARAPLPPLVKHETAARATPLQVYVKGVQPPIPPDPTPIPKVVKTPSPPPPALNPILQVRETKGPIFKRLDDMSESYLYYQLAKVAKDVDLESVKGTRTKVLAEARKDKDRKKPAILALRAERSDLKGLPMREGADCQARPEAVKKMQEISTTLRRSLGRPAGRASTSTQTSFLHAEQLQNVLRSSDKRFQDDGLSTLAQMLQIEDMVSRGEFAKCLAKVKGAKASVLLARQALFDLSWPVREEAIKALKDRPHEDYQQVLLDGLRYPWAPAAAHAAEVLAALGHRDSVFRLAALLDEPDPCAPMCDKNNKWIVAEVVRVNHLRNCLLCHAPSTARKDPLRAVVPTPGEPLPLIYYDGQKGDFVRADITYLRQDFSLIEHVAKPEKWPEWQRFDYLVRTRELTADELAVHKKKLQSKPAVPSYPQREAVLFALRELTGKNAGTKSTDWYDFLCTEEASTEP
ncbi:MAG TPA: HEAT repeat domain-containing protein [Gemmataceae bacterium]|nr:HEAT repeat domain-containing protein [Gemmataceae bacterium]